MYYSFVAPASVERAFEVAFLYRYSLKGFIYACRDFRQNSNLTPAAHSSRNDIAGLNKALVSKYGRSLDSVTRISDTTQMTDEPPAEPLETTFDYLMRPPPRPPYSSPGEQIDTSVLNMETERPRSDAGFKETQKGKKGSSLIPKVDVEEPGAMPKKAHSSAAPIADKHHSSSPPQRFFDGMAPSLPSTPSGDKGSKSNPLAKHEIEDLSSTDLIRVRCSTPCAKVF